MTTSVLVFATGCGLGALLYAWLNMWCFCLTPVLVLVALLLPQAVKAADA